MQMILAVSILHNFKAAFIINHADDSDDVTFVDDLVGGTHLFSVSLSCG